mmetsp:Transcript_36577/g.109231  ORF Transcript_36577/g.109231 Transcript_36577/m.109231 type:complete len:202 (+) Transcript_36577:965-1570(+)
MHADHVQHKDVATPSGHHVAVGHASEQPIMPRARIPHGAQPEPEGAADGRNSDGLIVELTAHRAHEMRRDNGHDAHGHDARIHAPRDLVRQEACEDGREGAEPGRDHATDVVDTHWSVAQRRRQLGQVHEPPLPHRVQDRPEGHDRTGQVDREGRHTLHALPDRHGRHLHAWVDRGADGPAKRIPRLIVVPLEELGEPMLS